MTIQNPTTLVLKVMEIVLQQSWCLRSLLHFICICAPNSCHWLQLYMAQQSAAMHSCMMMYCSTSTIRKTYLKTLGDRAFSSAAPTLWNSLPLEIWILNKLLIFKSKIKTVLFTKAYRLLFLNDDCDTFAMTLFIFSLFLKMWFIVIFFLS